ncbi:aldose 1-epimerase family protein [Aeoliella sp. ICT_H6.2]|uniref:Aldose 1-epimerase family protein n=1 Tax=Aeoliella straminimaris TaxID=2954799 RepID=A0A9X2FEM0_9BACT|nr:DUF4432 family protein [Aeoliella straminimaris]MCO6047660.1 aldose 1-epimerase family protein [Aeoliella straminimaris]
MSITTFDPAKFENIQQVGGIRTGSLDYPNPNGGQSCRVAFINTGAGLRFSLALDRGGDVVEASYNHLNLAYLTPNDYKPPSHAYHQGAEWLTGWPGGLVTTAGPELMGAPRTEGELSVSLHGRFSSTPTAVLEVVNPDPQRGQLDMRIVLLIRDTRMFGPSLEVRREVRCRLGEPWFAITDEVTNRGDERCRHALLYHVNFGYPLLDEASRLVYRGHGVLHDQRGELATQVTAEQIKKVSAPDDSFRGAREQLVIAEPTSDCQGKTHIGILNEQQQLGMSLIYSANALPRLASWLHYGPRGSYVASLEPFFGSILGRDKDNHPSATATLEPGQSKKYQVEYRICATASELQELASQDGPLDLAT